MKNQKLLIFLTLCLAVVLFFLIFLLQQDKKDKLYVYFLDIGLGDSIFVKTPSGQRIIIDGGPDNEAVIKLGKHLPFYDKTIDLMVLTHPDSDHLTGLLEILKRYPVKKILTTGVNHTMPQFKEWQQLIKDKGIEVQIAQADQEFNYGQVYFDILYPFDNLAGQTVEELNNTSIILRMDYGDHCFLLTGDAEIEVEEELLEQGIDLDCDILKAGHHGSDTSSLPEFLEEISPDYGVIQVGENRFGLPSRRIIYRLQRLGAEVLRNDELGEILFVSNGQTLQVRY